MIKTKIFVITKLNPTNDDEKTVVNMKHNLGTKSYIFSSLGKACFQSFALEKTAEPARQGLWINQLPKRAPNQLVLCNDGTVSHGETEQWLGIPLASHSPWEGEKQACIG